MVFHPEQEEGLHAVGFEGAGDDGEDAEDIAGVELDQ